MVGGTAMSFTAILVLHATPFQLGVLAAMQLVPGFLMGLVAGAWVDRLRRRPILIAADLGRALALGTIPLAALLDLLRIEQLYIVAFVVSILTIFFDVAYQSYLPSLVGRDELVEGNSKLSASAAVSEASGFAAAGWLVQLFTAPIAILIDAVSFVVSALFVRLIRTVEPRESLVSREPMRTEIWEGLREVVRHPILRPLAACIVTLGVSGGAYGTLVVLYMSEGLGFEPGILGMIWAVGGISSLFGAVAAGPAARRLGLGPALIAGLLLVGISMFFIPLAEGATVAAALLLIAQQLAGDGMYTIFEINQVSLRQAIAPERLLGRINATVQFLSLGASLAGSLAGGVLGEMIGVRATLVAGACGTLLAILTLVFSPIRTLRVAPTRMEEMAGPLEQP